MNLKAMLCPSCEKITSCERVQEVSKIVYKDVLMDVVTDYYRCISCQQEFVTEENKDILAEIELRYEESQKEKWRTSTAGN